MQIMLIRFNSRELGFSTAFLGADRGRGAAIVKAAQILGLRRIEMAAHLNSDPPAVLLPLFRAHDLAAVSVHNVFTHCGGDERFLRADALADPRPEEAGEAFRLTLETARAARALRAPCVVLHGGEIRDPALREIGEKVKAKHEKEGLSDEVRRLLEQGLQRIAPQKEAYLDRLIRNLHALLKAEPEITFCLETRYGFFEGPDLESMESVFDDLKNPRLKYWHDTGHCHAQEVLGLAGSEAWLDRFAGRLAGAHLHDAVGMNDHLPPGSGEIDFRKVLEALPGDAATIVEVAPGFSPAEVRSGVEELKAMGF